MGKGSSRPKGRRGRRPPPPVPISIPNFPFPPDILDYLMSQSRGFTISFTTPNGVMGSVPSEIAPTIKPNSTFGDEFAFTYATPSPTISAPVNAYSTTLAPTPAPLPTNPISPPTGLSLSAADLPGNIPIFWVAAIRAMEYVTLIGKITSYEQIDTLFIDTARALQSYNNTAALVYFCIVIKKLFAPFQAKFVYNYLSQTFPRVFIDAASYQRILIINMYSQKCNKMLNNYSTIPGNGYINVNDRVMRYAVPIIMKSIMDRLSDTNPIADLSE